jgi:hypothetical protein
MACQWSHCHIVLQSPSHQRLALAVWVADWMFPVVGSKAEVITKCKLAREKDGTNRNTFFVFYLAFP